MTTVDLPSELQSKIVGMSFGEEYRSVVDDMKRLQPSHGDSTERPFFAMGPSVERNSTKVRGTLAPLPPIMKPLYEAYPSNVEFASPVITFLSESRMREWANSRVTDIAFRYAGMGHVVVHAYDFDNDLVVSHIDGGANGFDRIANGEERRRFLLEYVSLDAEGRRKVGVPFLKWWEEQVRVRSECDLQGDAEPRA